MMKVRRILATKGTRVICVTPEKLVREAVALLTEHNIGALVVVDAQAQPVGMLSERDIVRQTAVQENLLDTPVADLMTRNVITGTPQDDIHSLAHTMTERRFRHMPIMENQQLVGIISIGDILKAERDQYRGEIDTLETQIMADES